MDEAARAPRPYRRHVYRVGPLRSGATAPLVVFLSPQMAERNVGGIPSRSIDEAFATLVQLHAGGLIVLADPFFNSRREQIVALAARYAVTAIYEWREFVDAGGLTIPQSILGRADEVIE